MTELSGPGLLREWQKLMESVMGSATAAAGRPELAGQLQEAMQHQLDLMEEVLERERRLQRKVAGSLLAPADAAFALLEESAATLRRQAEALEAAGHALGDTAGLVQRQAELFERAVGTLREPVDLAKSVSGLGETSDGR